MLYNTVRKGEKKLLLNSNFPKLLVWKLLKCSITKHPFKYLPLLFMASCLPVTISTVHFSCYDSMVLYECYFATCYCMCSIGSRLACTWSKPSEVKQSILSGFGCVDELSSNNNDVGWGGGYLFPCSSIWRQERCNIWALEEASVLG